MITFTIEDEHNFYTTYHIQIKSKTGWIILIESSYKTKQEALDVINNHPWKKDLRILAIHEYHQVIYPSIALQ